MDEILVIDIHLGINDKEMATRNQDYGKYKVWWRKIKDILVIDIHLGNNDKEMATRTKIMLSIKFDDGRVKTSWWLIFICETTRMCWLQEPRLW